MRSSAAIADEEGLVFDNPSRHHENPRQWPLTPPVFGTTDVGVDGLGPWFSFGNSSEGKKGNPNSAVIVVGVHSSTRTTAKLDA